MDADTQHALLDRIAGHRADGRGTDTAPSSMAVPTSEYTSSDRLAAERRLLNEAPTIVGLSGLVPEPRSHAAVRIGDASVAITRDDAGDVHALLNVCRHRGAEVAHGCGSSALLSCPYHGWTYGLDGSPVSRRRDEYFDDVPHAGLTRLPVAERDGLIWSSADPTATLPEQPLHGAERELAPFGLARYRRFAATTFRRDINWKLAIDTFCEAYHLPVLHRTTLAPLIHGDFALFDAFGPHGRLVAARKSVDELDDLEPNDRALLPHATILWFVLPNTVLIHQQDHVQLYQSYPGTTAGEAELSVSLYVPPENRRPDSYWQRNFDLLVEVTDTEDFATAAGIQRGYATAAQEHIVFGRNEPALQHFHRSLSDRLQN